MVKTAVQRKSTAPVAQDELSRYAAAMGAKQQFVSAAADMGWRMAIMVLVPVFIGVKLDDHYHTSPSYTLAALVVAVGGVAWIVSVTIKQVNRDQTVTSQKDKK
jgi:hypothetical protein